MLVGPDNKRWRLGEGRCVASALVDKTLRRRLFCRLFSPVNALLRRLTRVLQVFRHHSIQSWTVVRCSELHAGC